MSPNLKRRLRLLLLLFFVVNMGCDEPNVVIKIDNQVPPGFKFEGRGAIPFLVVHELQAPNPEDMSGATVIWDIRPNDLAHATIPVGPIKYGVLPDGFVQKVPLEGLPPALQEGKFYQVGGPPIEMPNGYLRFTIQNGKPVRL